MDNRGKKRAIIFWTLFSAIFILFILWVTPEAVRMIEEKTDTTEAPKVQIKNSKIVDVEQPAKEPPEKNTKEEPLEEKVPPEEEKTKVLPETEEKADDPPPKEAETQEAPSEPVMLGEPPLEEKETEKPVAETVKSTERKLEPVKQKAPAPEPLAEIAKAEEPSPERVKTPEPFSGDLVEPSLAGNVDKFDMDRLVKNQIYARGEVPNYLFNINNPDRIEIYELMNFRLFAKDTITGYYFDLKNSLGYNLDGTNKKASGDIKPVSEFFRLFGQDMISISKKNRAMNKKLRAKAHDGLEEVINNYFKRNGERRRFDDFSFYYVPPKNMNIYINKKNDTFVSFSGMKESNSIKVAGIVYKVTEGKNQRGIYFPVALLAKGDDGEYTLTDKEIDLEKYLREVDFDFKEIHKKYSANRILADLILSQKKVQKKYR